MPLTEPRLAEIAARHTNHSGRCWTCWELCRGEDVPDLVPYPCDAALLAQDLAALRQGLAGLEWLEEDGVPTCRFCRRVKSWFGHWGHAPGCALRALIAGGA